MAKTLKDRLPQAQVVEIKDPETGAVETTLKVVGNESKHFTNLYMKRVKEGKPFSADQTTSNVADLYENGVWYASAHIVEWDEGYFGVPFTLENGIEILSEPAASFIRDQVIAFVGDRESFFKKASTDSATA